MAVGDNHDDRRRRASKATTTKKYSDTMPIAAIGIGGLLVLCGAFFGRLREITLPGGWGIKLGDAAEALKSEVDNAVKDKTKDLPQAKRERVRQVAHREASARLLSEVATEATPSRVVQQVASEAVELAVTRVQAGG